jgi:hypothetical protein
MASNKTKIRKQAALSITTDVTLKLSGQKPV